MAKIVKNVTRWRHPFIRPRSPHLIIIKRTTTDRPCRPCCNNQSLEKMGRKEVQELLNACRAVLVPDNSTPSSRVSPSPLLLSINKMLISCPCRHRHYY